MVRAIEFSILVWHLVLYAHFGPGGFSLGPIYFRGNFYEIL